MSAAPISPLIVDDEHLARERLRVTESCNAATKYSIARTRSEASHPAGPTFQVKRQRCTSSRLS